MKRYGKVTKSLMAGILVDSMLKIYCLLFYRELRQEQVGFVIIGHYL